MRTIVFLVISLILSVIFLSVEVVSEQSVKPEMILIPGGTFEMGSNNGYDNEKPVHSVQVSSFYMGKYEVTNKEYCNFLNSAGNEKEGTGYDGKPAKWIKTIKDISEKNRSDYEKCFGITGGPKKGTFKVKPGYEDHPVVFVTWYGAVAYCNWLSGIEGLEKCYGKPGNRGNGDINKKGYRLPTEAEWEYACRAGSTTEYYWGDSMDGYYCWYCDNSGGNHHSVGKKLPNNFGLYDMSGNVLEWCNDWYRDYTFDYVINPAGAESGSYRVFRGGDCGHNAYDCRSDYRSCNPPDNCFHNLGFRLLRTD